MLVSLSQGLRGGDRVNIAEIPNDKFAAMLRGCRKMYGSKAATALRRARNRAVMAQHRNNTVTGHDAVVCDSSHCGYTEVSKSRNGRPVAVRRCYGSLED